MRNFNEIYKHNKRMLNGSSISIISSENTLCDVYINSLLKDKLQRQIPERRKNLANFKNTYKDKIIDTIKAEQVIGGMRDIKSLYWDTSLLDANEGIKFNNFSIPELRLKLPAHKKEPMVESMLWFLLTKEIPNMSQVENLKLELKKRSFITNDVKNFIHNLPNDLHPMTQLSSSIMFMQRNSVFAKKYKEGIKKDDYWDPIYEDIMNIIARIPLVASHIYKKMYRNNVTITNSRDQDYDYASNFCNKLGFNNTDFHELMRLYLCIHSDHEGGNASAHTCRLVGSTLADPYLSLSASMNALAGPLHGLANQEVLRWIMDLKKEVNEINKDTITEFVNKTLDEGKVVPGYGHAVLRVTDPRYLCQRDFALNYLPNDELFHIVELLYDVVPKILLERGKVKNPYPNVDSHSGVLLNYYGIKEYDYYTVLFGVGRTIGVLSQLFWDRALNLPLERPKSVTLECMK
tara:strand:- start:2236 stop:3621 length:1386 start_codon:yes stop_codon:yes gene_type:complete